MAFSIFVRLEHALYSLFSNPCCLARKIGAHHCQIAVFLSAHAVISPVLWSSEMLTAIQTVHVALFRWPWRVTCSQSSNACAHVSFLLPRAHLRGKSILVGVVFFHCCTPPPPPPLFNMGSICVTIELHL